MGMIIASQMGRSIRLRQRQSTLNHCLDTCRVQAHCQQGSTAALLGQRCAGRVPSERSLLHGSQSEAGPRVRWGEGRERGMLSRDM